MVQNSKILITGGYGFLGAYIAQRLAKDPSNTIVILDKRFGANTTGNDLGLDDCANVTTITGSVTDPDDMGNLDKDFDYIIHAAGYLGINNVANNQLDNMDINVLGSKYCLELAGHQTDLKRYLQFSTSEIYGVDSMLSKEDDDSVIKTTGHRWTYAASKLAGEYYLKAYVQKFGFDAVIVRPFNVYGAHRYGTNAMTALVEKAVKGETLQISGDGQQVRAWCHVSDFCEAVVALLSSEESESGEAFNIGDDNQAVTMEELAKIIIKVTDSKSKLEILGNSIEDVRQRKPDISKARQRLGYSPQISLERGVKEVHEWLQATGA